MATMIKEVYRAFKNAGVSDDDASAAAEAIATYEDRYHEQQSELKLLRWIGGVNIALSIAILIRVYLS